MKYTLLELTQTVLSSMDSDEINSINDTVESQQVVEVIKSVYDDIVSRSDIQSNSTLFTLVALGDPTKPIMMSKPDGVDKVEWIKYNGQKITDTAPVWEYVRYLPPEAFIDMMHQLGRSESNVLAFDYILPTGYEVEFVYRNDKAPDYYTTFDDTNLLFDSYDVNIDASLQASKTLAYGTRVSDFEKLDTYVPNLQPQQFALLLNEAKSLAWAELKQTVHQKAEAMARKNWLHLQRTRNQVPEQEQFTGGTHNFDKLPNFARTR